MILTFSREDTIDIQTERKTIVVPSRNQPKQPSSDNISHTSSTESDGRTTYYPSETCKLVRQQDAGSVESNFSPLTGVEMKTNQSKRLMMLDRALP